MGKNEGRPNKAVRQEKGIGFFVTKQQYFIIQQKASRAGVNLSDYLRKTAIYGEVKMRWSEEERELFKKLVGVSNDMNRLVMLCREEGALSAMLHFERYRNLIDEVIKQLDHDQ